MKLTILLIISLALSLSITEAQPKKQLQALSIFNVLKQLKNFTDKEKRTDSLENRPLGSFKEADFLRRYNFYRSLVTKLDAINKASLI